MILKLVEEAALGRGVDPLQLGNGSMALFMAQLAFGPSLVNPAKRGILEASVASEVSGLLGSCPRQWCRSAGPVGCEGWSG